LSPFLALGTHHLRPNFHAPCSFKFFYSFQYSNRVGPPPHPPPKKSVMFSSHYPPFPTEPFSLHIFRFGLLAVQASPLSFPLFPSFHPQLLLLRSWWPFLLPQSPQRKLFCSPLSSFLEIHLLFSVLFPHSTKGLFALVPFPGLDLLEVALPFPIRSPTPLLVSRPPLWGGHSGAVFFSFFFSSYTSRDRRTRRLDLTSLFFQAFV